MSRYLPGVDPERMAQWERHAQRTLKPGEKIRLKPGGQLYEVDRVTWGAAYIHKVYDPPEVRTFMDREGKEHRVNVSRGPVEPGISPTAFVYRDGEPGKEGPS